MKDGTYLGMRPGDLDAKRYARFWNPEMQPVPERVRDAVVHGPEAGELGLSLDEADRLMEAGDLPLENGTTVLASGHALVAVRTEMPGVTGAMFEWWMGWHPMEHQRYKLWHPRAHVANGTREMHGDDPTLSDRQKYMTTHFVTEYIGDSLQKIAIRFVEPGEILTHTRDFTANGVTALVCARVGVPNTPIVVGTLVHQIREVPGGSEMRSRFWLGKPEFRDAAAKSLRNRALGSGLVRRLASPPNMARDLLVHCAMEMNHLAGFLPELHAEYH